jgi:hypothetical protein
MKHKLPTATFHVLHDPAIYLSLRSYITGLMKESPWRLPKGKLIYIGKTTESPWQSRGFGFTRATEITVRVREN